MPGTEMLLFKIIFAGYRKPGVKLSNHSEEHKGMVLGAEEISGDRNKEQRKECSIGVGFDQQFSISSVIIQGSSKFRALTTR